MEGLSLKERLLNALLLKDVDRVPALSVTQTGTLELMKESNAYWPAAHRKAEEMAKLAYAAYSIAELEAVRVPFGIYAEAEALGCEIDYHEGETDRTPTVVKPASDPEKVEPVDPSTGVMGAIIEATKILKSQVGEDVPVIAGVTGPFTLACYVYGMEKTMVALITEPEKVEKILTVSSQFLLEYCKLLVEAGADVISLLEPTSSIIGPDLFEKFNLEYVRTIASGIKTLTVLHICGDSTPLVPMIARSGVKGLSVDQKVSIAEAKKLAKDEIAIIGNVDPVGILQDGNPSQVESESRRIITEGVNVLAPGCGLSPYTPTTNLKVMVKTARTMQVKA